MLRQLSSVEAAVEALRRGDFVLVYDRDGREGETDFVMAAEFVKPQHVHEMRREAGGLICAAIPSYITKRIGVPFMSDLLEESTERYPLLAGLRADDVPYGDKPAFSLTINHRRTFTGISDNDRALTIRELVRVVQMARLGTSDEKLMLEFGRSFRSPGHVHLLIGNGLGERTGHTELSLALAEMAGVTPVTVVCEMLDGRTGRSLSKADALTYAARNRRAFIEGPEVIGAYRTFGRA